MRDIIQMRLAIIVSAVWLMQPHFASAQDRSPIRYAVEENNRFFRPGHSKHYVEDLHLYLRCTARKKGAYDDTSSTCEIYRQRRPVTAVEVPDLRTGGPVDEYGVNYDKSSHSYPEDYALDRRRKVRFELDPVWMSANAPAFDHCLWSFGTASGTDTVMSKGCGPIWRDVELSLSSDGKELAWGGEAGVLIDTADGKQLVVSPQHVVVRDYLIVAMGDSFTSGEGNPERNHSGTMPAQWLDYRCNRSVFSYPVMTATALALADPRHSVTLVHVACSGAQVMKGLLEKYDGIIDKNQAATLWQRGLSSRQKRAFPANWKEYGTKLDSLPPQIDQVAGMLHRPNTGETRRPNLLLMSIGVNDVGFSDLLKHLALSNCGARCQSRLRDLREKQAAPCDDDSDRMRRSFPCLVKRLAAARTAVTEKITPQAVYLMEYIDPLRDQNGNLCSNRLEHKKHLLDGMLWLKGRWGIDLTEDEFSFADTHFYQPLKTALATTATEPSWSVPPPVIAHEKVKRGFCASPSWYHTFRESKARQNTAPGLLSLVSAGTLHPNGFGHYYLTIRVLSQLRADKHLPGHNLHLMTGEEFDFKQEHPDESTRRDGTDGFAFYLQDKHKDNLDRYHKY